MELTYQPVESLTDYLKENLLGICDDLLLETEAERAAIWVDLPAHGLDSDHPVAVTLNGRELEGAESMHLPIQSRGRTIGRVTMDSSESGAWSESDVASLQLARRRAHRVVSVADETAARLQNVAKALLRRTSGSRVTVRLLDGAGNLQLVTEQRALGVHSIESGPEMDPREHETYRHMQQNQETIVQNDCRVAEIKPPQSLIDYHHVLAQMLAPIVVEGKLRGAVSVHQQDHMRAWSEIDLDAISDAQGLIQQTVSATAG